MKKILVCPSCGRSDGFRINLVTTLFFLSDLDVVCTCENSKLDFPIGKVLSNSTSEVIKKWTK